MAWILDVVFFVILFLGTLIGAKVGFVRGVCRAAGWVLSFVIPFIFCVGFSDTLESWFGLRSAISNGIGNATLGGWLSIAISYVILFVIVKIATWAVGLAGKALKKSRIFNFADTVLGAVLGLLEAFFTIVLLLLVCGWLPIESLHAFIEESTVVGALYGTNLIGLLPGLGG